MARDTLPSNQETFFKLGGITIYFCVRSVLFSFFLFFFEFYGLRKLNWDAYWKDASISG